MANAEVKITMTTQDYTALKALLKYHAGLITREELKAVLASEGYNKEALEDSRLDSQFVPYVSQQLLRKVNTS